jgi:hypothetical protein
VGKDREIEGRDAETKRKIDRTDNKNPEQSRVAELVFYAIESDFITWFLINIYHIRTSSGCRCFSCVAQFTSLIIL